MIRDKEFGAKPAMHPVNTGCNNCYLTVVTTLLLPCWDKTQLFIQLLLSCCDVLSFILGTEDAEGIKAQVLWPRGSYCKGRGRHINCYSNVRSTVIEICPRPGVRILALPLHVFSNLPGGTKRPIGVISGRSFLIAHPLPNTLHPCFPPARSVIPILRKTFL